MGGGGGDDGYQQRQEDIEAKKQRARDLLNAQFGSVEGRAAPDRAKFTTPSKAGRFVDRYSGGGDLESTITDWVPDQAEVFDESGFNTAQSEYDQAQANAASRGGLYQNVRDTAFTAGKRKLDEQKEDAARKLKFELFARGLSGGSEDIDQNALLGRTYQQGVMDLGAKADAASAAFRGEDENTRLALLQAIDAGTDQGSAISSAMNQMKVNADRAAAEAAGTAAGDLFSSGEMLFNKSRASQGRDAGTEWWNQYQGGGKGSKAAATGRITQTQ